MPVPALHAAPTARATQAPSAPTRRALPGLVGLLLLTGLASATPPAASTPGAPPAPLPPRMVRVGLHHAEPVAFPDEHGRAQGFGVEMLAHIATLEGWTLDYVEGSWTDCLQRLKDGEIDLLFPFRSTPEREVEFDFTAESMLTTWGDLFVPANSDIDSLLDIAGRRVAVVEGDLFMDQLVDSLHNFEIHCTLVVRADWQAVFDAVVAGEADAGAINHITGLWHMDDWGLESAGVPFGSGPLELGVAEGRNQDLIAALDRRLAELRADPNSAYYELKNEWFSLGPDGGVPRWLIGLLAGTGGLLILAGGFAALLSSLLRARTAELLDRNTALEQEIADRLRAEEHRSRLEEQLRHSQKMEAIGQLASGIAHDVRNLLTVISAHAESVKHEIPYHRGVHESLRAMEDAVGQAATVTRSLLTFSRRIETQKEPLQLGDVLRGAARMLDRTLPANVDLQVDVGEEPTPWIHADETQLQQVLLNLALNARDAMPDGGTLRLSIESPPGNDGKRIELVVRDTGQGMDDRVRGRVFEPFFTTKEERGTGLGLATVHGIVTDHGGQISVESELGQGTTFRVTLPCLRNKAGPAADDSGDLAPAAAAAATAVKARGELVLLADDNSQIRQVVAASLIAAGFQVLQAGDGNEAVSKFLDHRRVELVVLDEDMPGRQGSAALAAMRAERPHLPAVLITGSVDTDSLETDDRTHWVSKPFGVAQLVGTVQELLRTAPVQEGA